MLQTTYCRYDLLFKQVAITSRERMTHKETYFIKVWDSAAPNCFGVGECAIFRGLSADDVSDYEQRLHNLCLNINKGLTSDISQFSSLKFGLETAIADLENGGRRIIFPSKWSQGEGAISINGLVWMGTIAEMQQRVEEKLHQGFRCIKFKIGGQDFDREVEMLSGVRDRFSPEELEIRLDANGAFSPENALKRLEILAKYDIHSLEQPIRAHQWNEMAEICRFSAIPIALDEELIGCTPCEQKLALLQKIKPQYIILKPSLCGGISGAKEWIDMAKELGIGWWVTSALESNVGLNALAQWVSILDTSMPQGLGTGNLYSNNIPSPIHQVESVLRYDTDSSWDLSLLRWK